MRFSNALPIKFYTGSQVVFNDSEPAGVDMVTYTQQFKNDDDIILQVLDEDAQEGIGLNLKVYDVIDDSLLGQKGFTKETLNGVIIYSISFKPSELGASNKVVRFKVFTQFSEATIAITEPIESFDADATNTYIGYSATIAITDTIETFASTATLSPPTYYRHRRGNTPTLSECDICPPNYGLQYFYTKPSDTTPTNGMEVYTDAALTTLFSGSSFWYAIEWNGPSASLVDGLQINNSGIVIDTHICSVDCP